MAVAVLQVTEKGQCFTHTELKLVNWTWKMHVLLLI